RCSSQSDYGERKVLSSKRRSQRYLFVNWLIATHRVGSVRARRRAALRKEHAQERGRSYSSRNRAGIPSAVSRARGVGGKFFGTGQAPACHDSFRVCSFVASAPAE